MTCSTCGFENREASRFCVECGTALALRCPGCGAEHQAGQKFCGECGTALTAGPRAPAAAPVAVRKTVTILFADLGGSTGFGERTDAEITREVLARYHALLQDTIDAHAGTVAKFMGDGMMATFGIPEVAEDDARRAVAAGADLQHRFEELATDIERRHGETLTLRVGINTGEVVIGEGDADLIGDALNVAARLEKECRPGHVLVGEETWRLTRGDVAYEELGEVSVAGRAQPVAAFELATGTETADDVAAPFVGREPEMNRLLAVLDDARGACAARLATVLGSPGVGKTRLARELCTRVDAQSVELRCDRAGEATFAPVAQLIRESAGLADDADAEAARSAIGTLLPESEADHARIVDVLAALVGAAPARSVEETFWAVRRLVEATAAAQPLVVVIDDIQWAEPLLLDLIEHLAEWVGGAAVLLLGLARPELREVRPALAEPGRPVADVLVLDGLDASATEALAAGLLGTERLPAGLVERLPESTDGNPLFVRELVRMLVDDRVVRRRDDGEWELTIDAEAVDVPPTIQSLLGARVERLPAPERELLELASVVGAEFSRGALRELAGDRAPVGPLLETMRRKELVEPTGTYWGDEPVYRFHHVLIRDAAYRRLLKTTRADLHERVAEWTDRTAADLIGEHEAAIAFHYEQAYRYRSELGTVDPRTEELARRGTELLTTAARRALGRDDLPSAGALSARALALLPESDAAARADLLTMGCECLLASGNGAAARPLVEELTRVAAGDDRLAAWADCFAAQLVGLTDPDGIVAAEARAEAAADTLTALEDGSGQAKAHQVRAGLLARLGRVGDCELELDLALAAARGSDDRRRVTAVLGAAPDAALFGPSPVARAGGRCLDVVRLLRITTASPAVEAASNRCQAVLESLRGRFDVSRAMLASARSSLEELGLRHGLAHTDLYAGMVEMIAGDPHAAIPPLRAAFGGLGALGVGADAGTAAALLARALLVDGQVDEADEMATASEHLSGQNLQTAIGWRVARAEVLAARGELADAVSLAEQAVEIAAGTDLVIDHADACVALGTLRARTGDTAGALAARADAKRLYEAKGATVPAARLDEQRVVAPGPGPADTPPIAGTTASASGPPSLSNAATELAERISELFVAGRFEECGRLYAEDARTEDRRSIIGTDLVGRAAHVTNFETTATLGSHPVSYEPVAIRGSTLALGRITMEFDDWNASFLALGEVGPDGLGARGAWFDDDALDAAMDELDAWFVAGEAADQAGLVALNAQWFRALTAFDSDAMRELADPAFRCVDRRHINVGSTDLDGFLEWWRQYADIGDFGITIVDYQIRGNASLITCLIRVVDAEIAWGLRIVAVVGPTERTMLVEIFDDADWDAALARLEELGSGNAPAGPPVIENPASRVHAQVIDVIASGSDEELTPLLAPEFRYDDRRTVVNMGDNDLAAARAHLTQLREAGYEWRAPTTIAVRGERLALARSEFRTGAGDDTSSLVLVEIDALDRLLSITQLDDGALDSAIDELDARYVAGEGAERADLVRLARAWISVFEHGDVDRIRDLAAPGFVWVDHQPLGWGTLDVDQIAELFRSLRGVENAVTVTRESIVGRATLITAENHATDASGGDVLWSFHVLGVADDEGRTTRVEVFAEDDLDGALARLEQLGRDRRSQRALENTASRVDARVIELLSAGADQELGELTAPDFRFEDRRHVVNFGVTGAAEAASSIQWLREEGFELETPQVVAIRGDRLVLSRRNRRTPAGDDLTSLAVVEVDDQGRLLGLVQFDDDKLEDAVTELDERYIAGEGAEHADIVRANAEWIRALNRFDFDAMRELAAPGLTFVDGRLLGLPSLDIEAFVELQRAYADMQNSWITAVLVIRDRHTLCSIVNNATDSHGGRATWALHSVGTVDASGRAERIELFDEGSWDAAVARFDELDAASSAQRPGPVLENDSLRCFTDMVDQANARDVARLRSWVTPGFVAHDRRSITAGPLTSGQEFVDAVLSTMDVFDALVVDEVVAIRGQRLVLSRSRFSGPGGFDVPMLVIGELGADGRPSGIVLFDDDDLDAAIEDLDARYVAGEGAEHADIVTTGRAWFAAINAHDYDALRELAEPDSVFADGRQLGAPTLDLDGFIEWQQGYADVEARYLAPQFRVDGRVGLVSLRVEAVDAHGGSVEWELFSVGVYSATGRVARLESFAEDDWAGALARFDELAAESVADARTPEVVNTSTRALTRLWTRARERRFDEVRALLADDVHRVDHRKLVAGPPTHGVDEYFEVLHAAFDRSEVDEVVVTPIAVRGERLSLCHVLARALGFEIAMVMLAELDEQGRITFTANHDEDAVAAALTELDERYLAGEGAAHARLVRTAIAATTASRTRDTEALAALLAPGFETVDHQHIGFGVGGRDHYLAWTLTGEGLYTIESVIFRTVHIVGDAALAVMESERLSDADRRYATVNCVLLAVDGAGRITHLEWFDLDDWDAALARLDDLGATDPRTPTVENDATRRTRDALGRAAAPRPEPATAILENAAMRAGRSGLHLCVTGRWDAFAAMIHPDIERTDRRRQVSTPPLHGRDAYLDALQWMTQFDSQRFEPVATRGDRAAAYRAIVTDDGGNEVSMVIALLVDASGRALHQVNVDDDLDGELAAIELLDDWYCAGEGAAHAYMVRRLGDGVRARARRDWEALTEIFAPGLVVSDHRLLSPGATDREGFVRMQRELVELVPDLTLEYRTMEISGDVGFGDVAMRGTPADGSPVAWTFRYLWRFAAGRIELAELFDPTGEARARVRFEELACADPRTPIIDNECVRVHERLVWLLAQRDDVSLAAGVDLIALDVVQTDRRRGVAAPDLVGRDARLENLAAVAATFGEIEVEPAAVRGERLALMRWTITADGGFNVTGYDVNELDEDGRVAVVTTFDDDDLEAALDFLESRYAELAGDTYLPVEGHAAQAIAAWRARDFTAWEACHAPGFTFDDRASIGAGMLDRATYLESLRTFAEMVPDAKPYAARHFARGNVMLASMQTTAHDVDGREFEWHVAYVGRFDANGRATQRVAFDLEQWDEALALFDEWSGSTSS